MELDAGKMYYFKFPEYTGFVYIKRVYDYSCNRCIMVSTCKRLCITNEKIKYLGHCMDHNRSDKNNIVITKPLSTCYFIGSPVLKTFFQTIGINTKKFRFTSNRVYYIDGGILCSKPMRVFNVFNYVPVIISEGKEPQEIKLVEPEEIDTISHGRE